MAGSLAGNLAGPNQTAYPARWWHPTADGRIECELCPRQCRLQEGQRAACFVRARHDAQMHLTTWGHSSGFCLDPIEKKPLHHFFPGTAVLSFGTAGCNLNCKFCQNWDISRAHETERLNQHATPQAIAAAARQHHAHSVAFTYNDPVIFAEYALDTAQACHAQGIKTVAVTAGYIQPGPAREFFAAMDAANIDLKSFNDDFYFKHCAGRLAPVLDAILIAKHASNCWVELTTLLIPGLNDSTAEIHALAQWVAREAGVDTPLHFSAFHPAWKMSELPATPLTTLQRARTIAQECGLQHVYTGNVRDAEGGTTYCPLCQQPLIVRDGYKILAYRLDPQGRCAQCGHALAGRFDPAPARTSLRPAPPSTR